MVTVCEERGEARMRRRVYKLKVETQGTEWGKRVRRGEGEENRLLGRGDDRGRGRSRGRGDGRLGGGEVGLDELEVEDRGAASRGEGKVEDEERLESVVVGEPATRRFNQYSCTPSL